MFSLLSYSSLALLFSNACLCLAAPLTARQWDGMRIPPPRTDPWYNTSGVSDLASLPPGTLLDMRAVEIPTGLQNTAAQAWQVKFRTTDSRFNATWAVTTLYTPKDRTNAALISYQHFYDSADVNDSPSYAITQSTMNGLALQLMVNGGIAPKHPNWYINIPDYEGPGASFGAGIMAGHATLDSIRVVRRLGRYTGLTEDVPVGMWGYSGGALATEWAAELQGVYAPELKITAAVIGGVTPNMTSVFETISSETSTHADLIPKVVRGLAFQYPELQPELIAATGATPWEAAIKALEAATRKNDHFATLRGYVNNLLAGPAVKNVLQIEGLMGYYGGVPQMPLFIHHAELDEVAPVQDVRKLVARYCGLSRAVDIVLSINTTTVSTGNGMHYDEGLRSAGLALDTWLPDAFAGRNLPQGCSYKEV